MNAWPPGWDDGIERAFVEDYPDRVKRLRGIGNAIVPQVAQLIFAQILVVENSQ